MAKLCSYNFEENSAFYSFIFKRRFGVVSVKKLLIQKNVNCKSVLANKSIKIRGDETKTVLFVSQPQAK